MNDLRNEHKSDQMNDRHIERNSNQINKLSIDSETLIVEPRGINRLWGFHKKLEFPLAHVIGATYDPQVHNEPKGFRSPGLATPGRWVGTFRKDGEKHYWSVRKGTNSIVISLRDEKLSRLFLTVDHPRELVDDINAAIERVPACHHYEERVSAG